jgi:serine acetyltransferase
LWFLVNILYALRKGFSPKSAILCDINFRILPNTTRILHPFGIIMGRNVVIGENCTIAQGVTLMRDCEIGEGVFIGANAVVSYGVKVGKNAKIGAGAVVLKNVPVGKTAVGFYK